MLREDDGRRSIQSRFFNKFIRRLRWISRRLPNGHFGDWVVSTLDFIEAHGRLPRRRDGSFLDYLHRLKLSGELLETRRQMITDKEFGKLFVNYVLGDDYAVPTMFVLRSPDEVEIADFPADCVIKPTHNSGEPIVRRANEPLDLAAIQAFFEIDYYRIYREGNYRYLEHKVIIEPIAFDGEDFYELNIQCFNGVAKIISVKCEGGAARERRDRYWNIVDIASRRPKPKAAVPKPEVFDQIIWAAEKIAAQFEYIRVDLYTTGREFLIGEVTNCHTAALMTFQSPGDEEKYSKIIFGDAADHG